MSSILSRSVLLIIYSGALAVGLTLIGLAVFSLLRSFTPGSQPAAKAHGRRLNRGAAYSLGLGAAVLGGVGLLALLLRAGPGTSALVALGAGLLAGLVAALIHGLVDNSLFLMDLSYFFFLCAGLFGGLRLQEANRQGTTSRV